MMKSINYRISKDRDEIINVLLEKQKEGLNFIVWQKASEESTEREFVVEASIFNVDREAAIFYLKVTSEKKAELDLKKPTYFLLKGQDFVFKTNPTLDGCKEQNLISFSPPKEIRLVEKRTANRVYFKETDYKEIKATFYTKKIQGEDSLPLESMCKVYNISKTGICLIISKQTFNAIDFRLPIHLTGLNFYEDLIYECDATLKNTRIHIKKTIKSDEFYAIGLQFEL